MGPYVETVPRAWEIVFKWLDQRSHHQKMGTGYGLAHDDPHQVHDDECRYFAGVPVPAEWEDDDEKFVQRIPFSGGAFVVREFGGVYPEMGQIIRDMYGLWVPERGITKDAGRPIVTLYYDDPRNKPAKDLVADVCVPVHFESNIK